MASDHATDALQPQPPCPGGSHIHQMTTDHARIARLVGRVYSYEALMLVLRATRACISACRTYVPCLLLKHAHVPSLRTPLTGASAQRACFHSCFHSGFTVAFTGHSARSSAPPCACACPARGPAASPGLSVPGTGCGAVRSGHVARREGRQSAPASRSSPA